MPQTDATTWTGTTSSLGQRSQMPVAGAASVIATVACGEGYFGDTRSIRHSTDMGRVTSVAAPGCRDRGVASNASSVLASARSISVVEFRSSGANYRLADGGEGRSGGTHSIQRTAVGSCHKVGAATLVSVVPSPITAWADRISDQRVDQPGPTFLLARSSRETATGFRRCLRWRRGGEGCDWCSSPDRDGDGCGAWSQRGFVVLVTTKWGAVSAERYPVCNSTPSLA